MLEWAVIADDLTGAADTGVQFLPVCAPVFLVDHRRVGSPDVGAAPRALTVFTTSRALTPGDARRVVAAAARALRLLEPGRVYKKIDSGLRGNIGMELEGVMEVLDIPVSFIAPAFPDQGRTTAGGIHRIHGVPVAESEMGRDPVTPVTESSVPKWIGAQTAWPVGHVGIDVLERGIEAAGHAVDRLRARGVRHIGFDATAPAHLDLVARLGLERFPEALLCGAAGLAQRLVGHLLRHRGPSAVPAEGPAIRLGNGGVLFVCGSASERLLSQTDRLVACSGAALEVLAPQTLLTDAAGAAAALDRAVSALARGDLVLRLAPRGPEQSVDPHRLVSALAEFAAAVARRAPIAGLFLSGGDTALAVLERLEVAAVRLEHELASGLGYGVLSGGPLTGRPVVTKAGSFGGPDTLLDMIRLLRPQGETGGRSEG
jgi:D-threonate/D-erythronate kinase